MFIVSRLFWESLSSTGKFTALALGFQPERPAKKVTVRGLSRCALRRARPCEGAKYEAGEDRSNRQPKALGHIHAARQVRRPGLRFPARYHFVEGAEDGAGGGGDEASGVAVGAASGALDGGVDGVHEARMRSARAAVRVFMGPS